jgi:hypothetical protein
VVPFDHAQHSGPRVQPPKPPAPPPEDDAFQRGRSEGYAAAFAELEQKLADEKHRLSVQFSEERQNLLNGAAAKIASDIEEAGKQLEAKIAGVTARVLEPFISSAMQKQAVTSFVEQLASIASDGRRPALRITGPSDLLELVRSKLGVRDCGRASRRPCGGGFGHRRPGFPRNPGKALGGTAEVRGPELRWPNRSES